MHNNLKAKLFAMVAILLVSAVLTCALVLYVVYIGLPSNDLVKDTRLISAIIPIQGISR